MDSLVDIIKKNSPRIAPREPPPLPPGWKAWKADKDGKNGEKFGAVLFDVYGTLFCSAAGDIGGAEDSAGGTSPRLDEFAAAYAPGYSGKDLKNYFRESVLVAHRDRALSPGEKTCYPEIKAEEIWARFLAGLSPRPERTPPEEFALRYELAVNPAYPMPGAFEAIRCLRDVRPLGIVSNAQFYTPLLFEAFFGGKPEDIGFDRKLLVYSFEAGEAKPSPRLFVLAAERLAAMGLKTERCLFVGNDMRNDMAAAGAAGFRTALFAGDGRSLRLREAAERPSYIIDSLADLPGLCMAG
jgi:putative hydrolase of the HAD superfamily